MRNPSMRHVASVSEMLAAFLPRPSHICFSHFASFRGFTGAARSTARARSTAVHFGDGGASRSLTHHNIIKFVEFSVI